MGSCQLTRLAPYFFPIEFQIPTHHIARQNLELKTIKLQIQILEDGSAAAWMCIVFPQEKFNCKFIANLTPCGTGWYIFLVTMLHRFKLQESFLPFRPCPLPIKSTFKQPTYKDIFSRTE